MIMCNKEIASSTDDRKYNRHEPIDKNNVGRHTLGKYFLVDYLRYR